MSDSTFKRFTQASFEECHSAASAAFPAVAKLGAIAPRAAAEAATDAVISSVSLNAAAATAWAADAKAMGRAAVPW